MATLSARWIRLLAGATAALAASTAAAADLAAPSYDGGPDESGYGLGYGRRDAGPRPQRRVTGGPGYVGQEWGLGKPSYYGIGTRPDWGRSSVEY